MLKGRNCDEWIAQYATSHQNRCNQLTHSFGIPMIVLSILLAVLALAFPLLWFWAIGLFLAGWLLQLIHHAIEGKPPEFFSDWRFLLVGPRWWRKKITGRL